MNMCFKGIFAVLFIFFTIFPFSPLYAKDKKITWFVMDLPPSWIIGGPYKGKGQIDLIAAFLKENLADYSHDFMVMNFTRFFSEAESGKNVCGIGASRTAGREKIMHYSLPAMIHLPMVLVARKNDIKSFRSDSISLREFMNNSKLRGEFIKSRSYTPEIDSMLSEYGNQENIGIIPRNVSQLYKKLIKKRIDYMVTEPKIAMYLRKMFDKEQITAVIPIKEIENDSYFGHVICTRNEWGRQVISDIDDILRNERASQKYRYIMEQWHDETSVEKIRDLYDEFLKSE